MKKLFALILAGVLAAGAAQADSFAERNAEKLNKIVAAAVAAHGGSAGLDSIETLIIENDSDNYAVGQSLGTEPPWDKNHFGGLDAIDLRADIYVNHNIADGGGFQSNNSTIINGDESYAVDMRAGTVSRIAQPDFATASGPFVRVTPALLVRALRDRASNAHYLGETRVDGKDFDVVGFSMTVGPALTLYFDKSDHMLKRSERVLPAFGLVEYRFEDYESIAGIPMNANFKLYVNGDLNIDRRIAKTKVNAPMDDLLVVDSDLQMLPDTTPDALARYDVGDDAWLIGGSGTYAMFVDMGEYVFAAGGTAGMPDRIRLAREVVGDKPIRYGMLTHHHSDHVVAVSTYETEGAEVIAAAAHETTARNAAENGAALKVKTVSDKMTLEAGGRVIEIIDIGPTAHTGHLLVAWLPKEGILFQADHFSLPPAGPVRPAVESTRTFAAALTRHNLRPTSILSAHSPRIATMADVELSLQAELYSAR